MVRESRLHAIDGKYRWIHVPVQRLGLAWLNGYLEQTHGIIFKEYVMDTGSSMNGLQSQRPFQDWALRLRLSPRAQQKCAHKSGTEHRHSYHHAKLHYTASLRRNARVYASCVRPRELRST